MLDVGGWRYQFLRRTHTAVYIYIYIYFMYVCSAFLAAPKGLKGVFEVFTWWWVFQEKSRVKVECLLLYFEVIVYVRTVRSSDRGNMVCRFLAEK